MKSNCKLVNDQIDEHILEEYTLEALKDQVKSMLNFMTPTPYHVGKHMTEGGSFLVYTQDMTDYLNSLGINPDNREYPDDKVFALYCHLIARGVERLYRKASKEEED